MKPGKSIDFKVVHFGILCVGLAGILDSLIMPFFTSFNLGIALPGALGLVLVIYSIDKIWFKKDLFCIRNRSIAFIIRVISFIILTIFLFIETMIISNSDSSEAGNGEYLVVLGAGLRGSEPSKMLRLRLDTGIKILHENRKAVIVVSGGKGRQEDISESEAMHNYLVSRGISQSRIVRENKSKSTYENFLFSKKMIEQRSKISIEELDVVTSGFHVYRARMIAKKVGVRARITSSPTPNSVLINCYLREFFAVLKTLALD